jgi:hypothetical protein
MPVETAKDMAAATNALMQWFKSQEMQVSDAMITMEYLIATLIVDNSKDSADMEAKINLTIFALHEFIAFIGVNGVIRPN